MPFYHAINASGTAGKRTIERLLALREHLAREIPKRTRAETLLLATWNIREFDSSAYGTRVNEAFYYIAEIVASFDLVAVQEVRRDLDGLERLCRILGSHWKYVITDVTRGRRGNSERLAFLYDSNKVDFAGLVGEIVIPPIRTQDEEGNSVYRPVTQLARTPFMAGFKAGWTKFILTTVHILYGESKANSPERVAEIRRVADFMAEQAQDDSRWTNNFVLLGDFNIFRPQDETMQAILEAGFVVPEELQDLPSNVPQNKFYDQIAFRVREDRFGTTGRAGVFNFYESVFRDEDESIYVPQMGDRYLTTSKGEPRQDPSRYYKTYWRTHQMSDHLPMWVELQIDYSDEYLSRKLADGG